jgi:hypothetical protein
MLRKQQGDLTDNRNGAKAQHALDYSREIFSLLVIEMWHKSFRL